MPVELRSAQRKIRVDYRRLKQDARRLLTAVGRPEAVLSILLTDDRKIAQLHERWMDLTGPTDVMSFPMGGEILGDIVISVETAARRSPRNLQQEIRRYLIHGLLHLNGHDHLNQKDRTRMNRQAARLSRVLAEGITDE